MFITNVRRLLETRTNTKPYQGGSWDSFFKNQINQVLVYNQNSQFCEKSNNQLENRLFFHKNIRLFKVFEIIKIGGSLKIQITSQHYHNMPC
jgi:hypothetical protein